MKTHLLINEIRATVFLPFLSCNWDILCMLQEILPKAMPYLSYDRPLMDGDLMLPPGSWTVVSPTREKRIIVQPQKVDFINSKLIDNDKADEHWGQFLYEATEVFKMLMNSLKTDASRLAIAPTYFYRDGLDNWKDYIKNSFSNIHFEDSEIDVGEFSQTFRLKKSLADKIYRYNYLSKFYFTNQVVIKDGMQVLEEYPTIGFDINTINDQGYSFNFDAVKNFFSNAPQYSQAFLSHYFD